jgi:hypothetical protein
MSSLLAAPPAPNAGAASSSPAQAAKVAPPTAAQLQMAERLVGPALTEGHAWARLVELTDSIGPRLSGSVGAEAAVQWALRSFKADGVRAWTEPVKVPHWVRGEEHAELLSSDRYFGRPLHVMALGDSAPTPSGGITAEVVEVSSLEELAALGDRVKGRIVLFRHDMKISEDYGKFAVLRGRGPSAAAKAGAVGALVPRASMRASRPSPPLPSPSRTLSCCTVCWRGAPRCGCAWCSGASSSQRWTPTTSWPR